VKMPVRVPDPIARRDIIAYLQQVGEQHRKPEAKSAAQGSGY